MHERTITVEVRSVNNRYLDCTVKMPRMYLFAEDALKSLVQGSISRGKVDVFVSIDQRGAEDVQISVNQPVAEGYYKALLAISEQFGLPSDVNASTLARFSDVLLVEKQPQDVDTVKEDLLIVLGQALVEHMGMRQREGARMKEDIDARLNALGALVEKAEARSPKTVGEYRAKLEQRMREVLEHTNIEESRILTEVAIFADKVAVNEEIVRLRSHMEQVGDLLCASGPQGRKLDFLMQELNREANTIGSKGNDVEMARLVVDMKAEIEKIREQVQNIE